MLMWSSSEFLRCLILLSKTVRSISNVGHVKVLFVIAFDHLKVWIV